MLHCKECQHWQNKDKDFNQCDVKTMTTGANNFCSDAEPRIEKAVEVKKPRAKK